MFNDHYNSAYYYRCYETAQYTFGPHGFLYLNCLLQMHNCLFGVLVRTLYVVIYPIQDCTLLNYKDREFFKENSEVIYSRDEGLNLFWSGTLRYMDILFLHLNRHHLLRISSISTMMCHHSTIALFFYKIILVSLARLSVLGIFTLGTIIFIIIAISTVILIMKVLHLQEMLLFSLSQFECDVFQSLGKVNLNVSSNYTQISMKFKA